MAASSVIRQRALAFCISAPLLALLFAGCRSSRVSELQRDASSGVIPQPYLRVVESASNRVELQIAVRQFVPQRKKGPAVWLTGVSHLGAPDYYAALQRHLDQQDLVLFEGIHDRAPGQPRSVSVSTGPNSTRGSLQSSMAEALGLVFQLDAIDYDRTNFMNSDLSVAEIRTLLVAHQPREGGSSTSSFDELLQLMEADSFFSGFIRLGLGLVASSPRLQAWSRLMLIEVLGEIGGDPSNIPGVPAELRNLLEVLIQKRNEKAVVDLESHMPCLRTSGSAAIFYGSGHMPDLEVQLRRRLHYVPAVTSWFTAFSVDLNTSGISPAERDMVRSMAKKLLESVSGQAAVER